MLGGNLSTNAGGLNVIRYGMARELVLGLEVVLADGRVLDTLTGLRKDNTGYDVKSLFLGAEGTLGIITAACLKLYPALRSRATAFVAVRDPEAAVALLGALRAGQRRLRELVRADSAHRRSSSTTRHIPGVVDPLAAPSAVVRAVRALDLARQRAARDAAREDAGAAHEAGWVRDAASRMSEREREAFWRLRESIPEAQRKDGASLKHDISVPVSQVPRFIEVAGDWVEQNIPQGVLVAYGHLGDGNLHFNVNQRAGTQAFQLQAVEQKVEARHPRPGARVRRQLQRRTRHRPAQGVRARALRAPGRTRPDAPRQEGARSERHHESRQGAAADAARATAPRPAPARRWRHPARGAPWTSDRPGRRW